MVILKAVVLLDKHWLCFESTNSGQAIQCSCHLIVKWTSFQSLVSFHVTCSLDISSTYDQNENNHDYGGKHEVPLGDGHYDRGANHLGNNLKKVEIY